MPRDWQLRRENCGANRSVIVLGGSFEVREYGPDGGQELQGSGKGGNYIGGEKTKIALASSVSLRDTLGTERKNAILPRI